MTKRSITKWWNRSRIHQNTTSKYYVWFLVLYNCLVCDHLICYFKKNNTMYIVPKLSQNAVCVQPIIKIYAMEEFWHWDSCTICFERKDHLTFIITSCLFHKIDSPGGLFLKSFAFDLCVCIKEFDLIVLWQRYPWMGEEWVSMFSAISWWEQVTFSVSY